MHKRKLYTVHFKIRVNFLQITVHTADQDDDAQDDESHGLHAGQPFCFFARSLSLTTDPLTKTIPIRAPTTLEIFKL